MTTDLAVLASDPTSLDLYDDPGQQIVLIVEMDGSPLGTGPMSVYVAYGESGVVLYVGQTCDVRRRLIQHRQIEAHWWMFASEVRVISGLTHDAAHLLERSVIEGAAPIFNVHHNRSRR